MPSCRFYMAMKLDDLRHELASRNLPTEGLKKDLAFRPASLDDAHDWNPSIFYPHRTNASSSINSNEEDMPAKTGDHNIQSIEVGERSPKQSSPSPIDLSLPTMHNNHHHGDDDRRKSNLARFSIAFTTFLRILLMLFLSYVPRLYISTEDKEYFSRSNSNGYDFLSLRINNFLRLYEVAILTWLPFNIQGIPTSWSFHKAGKEH